MHFGIYDFIMMSSDVILGYFFFEVLTIFTQEIGLSKFLKPLHYKLTFCKLTLICNMNVKTIYG